MPCLQTFLAALAKQALGLAQFLGGEPHVASEREIFEPKLGGCAASIHVNVRRLFRFVAVKIHPKTVS